MSSPDHPFTIMGVCSTFSLGHSIDMQLVQNTLSSETDAKITAQRSYDDDAPMWVVKFTCSDEKTKLLVWPTVGKAVVYATRSEELSLHFAHRYVDVLRVASGDDTLDVNNYTVANVVAHMHLDHTIDATAVFGARVQPRRTGDPTTFVRFMLRHGEKKFIGGVYVDMGLVMVNFGATSLDDVNYWVAEVTALVDLAQTTT